jgi:hypothetical protein
MNTTTNYLTVSLELVADRITPEAAWVASSVRNLSDSLDVEVDIMTVLQALHQLATDKRMTKVSAALEEAFDCSYDALLAGEVDTVDDLYEDEADWL